MDIVGTILRFLFAWIDKIVAWAINVIYDLIIRISDVTVFNDAIIETLGSRISIILGIFMLFKVSFSLVNYALNPDSFTDKEKGAGKLVTNIIIMLVMLVSFNMVFKQAFNLQGKIIKSNVLANIIFGVGSRDTGINNEEAGNEMAFYVYSAFMQPNPDSVLGNKCDYIYSGASNVLDSDGNSVDVQTKNTECLSKLQESTSLVIMTNFSTAIAKHDSQKLLDYDLILAKENGEFLFDYIPIISTVCGIIILLVLIQFCFDIAIRSVKLGFLQLIAPIPIISYIDPKSSKDGMFKKWLKTCLSTYADLFIRLLALFFAIFVITALLNNSMVSISTGDPVSFWTDPFVKIMIILGALLFAKQLPQLISDLTGIKLNGGFTLNPMKRLGQSPFAAGAVGAVGGAVGGMAANAWAAKQNGLGFGKGLKSTVAGGLSAGFRGGKAGLTSGGKGSALSAASKGISDSSRSRNLRDKGYGAMDKIMDKATDLAGIKYKTGTTSKMKSQVNELQQDLANSRRNEQSMTTAFNQQMATTGNKMAGLLKTFNGEIGARDAKGNITSYAAKTYSQYAEEAAKKEALAAGEDWTTMDDARKAIWEDTAAYNDRIVDRNTFDSYNELYQARNEEDIKGRKLEKQINDIQDDMGKMKGTKDK